MKISIGILAHNEQERIARTLSELLNQDLLHGSCANVDSIEIICAPNGCHDQTAAIARQVLDEAVSRRGPDRPMLCASVHESAEPGKSRTWNRLVHEYADQTADVLFLVDGDIQLPQRACLSMMFRRLIRDEQSWACVNQPQKDTEYRRHRSLGALISRLASRQKKTLRPAIAGSLYCIRGEVARQVWMPNGLLVEDGFLKAVLVTEFFTRDGARERLVREEEAFHVFEAYRGMRANFRHQVRLTLGVAQNAILYDHLWQIGKSTHVGEYIAQLNKERPEWFAELIRDAVQHKRRGAVPPSLVVAPLRQLRNIPFSTALRTFPSALLRFVFGVPVYYRASRCMHAGKLDW